jgi:hypothetical protein
LDHLSEDKDNIRSVVLSDRVQTSTISDPTAQMAVTIVDLQTRYFSDIVRLLKLKYDICALIDNLKDGHLKLVMVERYQNFKTFEDIAYDNYFSVRTVHNLHRRALAALEPFYRRAESQI